jgi:hypothetical protein
MRLLIVVTFIGMMVGLAGCVSAPVKYTAGASMTHVSDEELINHALRHMIFVNSVYASQKGRDEVQVVVMELESRHPEWAWPEIRAGKVKVGMTENEVRVSWGYPTKINRASYGDQWVYQRSDYSAQYVYFENGRMTAFN